MTTNAPVLFMTHLNLYRELSKLVEKGIIKRVGATGKGTKYVFP